MRKSTSIAAAGLLLCGVSFCCAGSGPDEVWIGTSQVGIGQRIPAPPYRSGDDDCALRRNSLITTDELREASALVRDLQLSRDGQDRFRESPDDGEMAVVFTCGTKCSISSAQNYFKLGNIGDFRRVFDDMLQVKINRTICRLRGLGVDFPRP